MNDIDKYCIKYGEQYRPLFKNALYWLYKQPWYDENFNVDQFIHGLIERVV